MSQALQKGGQSELRSDVIVSFTKCWRKEQRMFLRT